MKTLLKVCGWTLGALALIFGVLYLWVFDVWHVQDDDALFASSIRPTLFAGDVLLVRQGGDPSIGRLVRCQDPDAAGRFIIGRVVAEASETIELQGEALSVGGKRYPPLRGCDTPKERVNDPRHGSVTELSCSRTESRGVVHEVLRDLSAPEPDFKATVPGSRVFLLSDNLHVHLDSRDFGAVPRSSCHNIVMRLWDKKGYGGSKERFKWIR